MMPSSLTRPVAYSARDDFSVKSSTAAVIIASCASLNSCPVLAAAARRTIDITPASCFGPITAIFAVGQVKMKRVS